MNPDNAIAHAEPSALASFPDDPSAIGAKASRSLACVTFVTVAAGLVMLVGAMWNPRQFYFSYLFGYVFALDIVLGAIFWVLIHHVSDAGWSVGLRRVFENITRASAPLGILVLPVLIGAFTGHLYGWYNFIHGPEPVVDSHEHHQWHVKHFYFNTWFVLARVVIYFGVWVAYAGFMRAWSVRQDTVGGTSLTHRMQWWAPTGVALLGLTTTFFAFDLLMSLQYTWFSTIYGVLFWVGGIRGSLSLVVLLVLALRSGGYLRNTITMEHLHDVAKLMFGFTVFWAYIAFAQYFLIWYGNMPEETQFYLLRRNGSWYLMSMLLPILYFVVPFFLLLPRANKRNPVVLAITASWILLLHACDLYWQVMPVLHSDRIHVSALDIASPVALLGVVLICAIRGFQKSPLIPIRDARLSESIGYENETP